MANWWDSKKGLARLRRSYVGRVCGETSKWWVRDGVKSEWSREMYEGMHAPTCQQKFTDVALQFRKIDSKLPYIRLIRLDTGGWRSIRRNVGLETERPYNLGIVHPCVKGAVDDAPECAWLERLENSGGNDYWRMPWARRDDTSVHGQGSNKVRLLPNAKPEGVFYRILLVWMKGRQGVG